MFRLFADQKHHVGRSLAVVPVANSNKGITTSSDAAMPLLLRSSNAPVTRSAWQERKEVLGKFGLEPGENVSVFFKHHPSYWAVIGWTSHSCGSGKPLKNCSSSRKVVYKSINHPKWVVLVCGSVKGGVVCRTGG